MLGNWWRAPVTLRASGVMSPRSSLLGSRSEKKIGRGSRSRTCFLMLPRHPSPLLRPHRVMKMVDQPGNAPGPAACKAAVLSFDTPGPLRKGMGTPPWCCPRHGGFWKPSCTSWCAARPVTKRGSRRYDPGIRAADSRRNRRWISLARRPDSSTTVVRPQGTRPVRISF